ncbi:SID1 transmembrane family member 1-like isoform X2 [Xenia sp. Carnegie-2017]|uniref:SID1 transmembrane family member 1-like isoform X2 n=1 Tax=Xenia sp. Carnegie-2017 TaxID=2897299 RepID=UPI001F0354E4|nr:SID1 transmembrane family member 1-like isoform X2 [Xenia sp. Carnegie-2017]
MNASLHCLVIILILSNVNVSLQFVVDYMSGNLGEKYEGAVSIRKKNIYVFTNPVYFNHSEAVIVEVRGNASLAFPLVVVIQQQKTVSSLTLPIKSEDRQKIYAIASNFLCYDDQSLSNFSVSLLTSSLTPVNYTLYPKILHGFLLRLDKDQRLLASPTQPAVYSFQFPTNVDTVLVKAESKMSACSIVSIQGTKKENFPINKFYIVVVVLFTNQRCRSGKNNQNPFRDDVFRGANSHGYSSSRNTQRLKEVKLKVVKIPSENEYFTPILVPIFVFLSFYFIAAVVILFQKKFLKKQIYSGSTSTSAQEGENLVTTENLTSSNYGSVVVSEGKTEQLSTAVEQNVDDINEEDAVDFDFLADVEQDKDVYRLKKYLFLSDLSRKTRKRLHKKYNLYQWYLMIIAVFYTLPVVQLVFTYQRVLNASGDQDICYYNFYCSRPLGALSSFNNVYSNIGYIMLGVLFFILVWRRDGLHPIENVEQRTGIPHHYGIFYALGLSLIMEGILSACYHVCPSYTNFQFDTSFMYIIASLIIIQLYSTRHPDLAAKPHVVFAILAAIIIIAVSGVVFKSYVFWAIFCFVLISFSVYTTTQMYYMGRIRFSFQEMRRLILFLKLDLFSCPMYKDRMVLLLLANTVNWGLAINGIVNEPKDFASYLLAILIVNGLIYLLFYVFMKLRNKERISCLVAVCSFFTLACWIASLSFFMQGLTSWRKSPAYSRENNKDCFILSFYDYHDIWHFLSAISLFCSLMILLTLNDDLEDTPREKYAYFSVERNMFKCQYIIMFVIKFS